MKIFLFSCIVSIFLYSLLCQNGFGQSDTMLLNQAFEKYWNSTDILKKQRAAKKIVKLNPSFDEVYQQLQKGKLYSLDVKTGFFEKVIKSRNGLEHPNMIFVPFKYNPKNNYQVRVFLHGGVGRKEPKMLSDYKNLNDTAWNSVSEIMIYPAGWAESEWWHYSQVENMIQLLRFVKENYNVDENHICLNGISDGATGVFYLANIHPTSFSCYLPFIGSMEALNWLAETQIYLQNYQGGHFFIVNGKHDEVFNILYAKAYVDELKKIADEVIYIIVDTCRHSTNWYPVLQDSIEGFINIGKRNPFPDKVNFATENVDSASRKFWIKVERLGHPQKESALPDSNIFYFRGKPELAYQRRKPFGQLEAEIRDNVITVNTNGILSFTLLLSPEQVDFTKPVKIITNQEITYEGMLKKSVKTLIEYNITDNDRTMLYGAEIKIWVGKKYKP